MEIRGVSQGGQNNYELVNRNSAQGDTISNESEISLKPEVQNSDGQKDVKDKSINEKDVKKAVDKLNKFLEDEKSHAEYSVHDKFGDLMIKIVDDQTGKTIQELPPRKILDMVAKMCEMVGIILDKKA